MRILIKSVAVKSNKTEEEKKIITKLLKLQLAIVATGKSDTQHQHTTVQITIAELDIVNNIPEL